MILPRPIFRGVRGSISRTIRAGRRCTVIGLLTSVTLTRPGPDHGAASRRPCDFRPAQIGMSNEVQSAGEGRAVAGGAHHQDAALLSRADPDIGTLDTRWQLLGADPDWPGQATMAESQHL